MRKIPNGWTETTIGEVYTFVGGGTPSKSKSSYWNGDIPWASIKDISQIKTLKETQDSITEEGLKNSASNVTEINDVILGTRMLPGKPVIASIRTAINQDLKIVKPKIPVPSKFTFYQFEYLRDEFLSRSGGTTVQGITIEKINEIPFLLPPLPEQKRIVAKLDTLFSHLDQLRARLEKIPVLLKQFRQAVLTQAVTGKLTEEWRRKNRSPNWEIATISDVLSSLDQGWSPKCENYSARSFEKWGVIKTTAVQSMYFIEAENKQLPSKLKPRSNLELMVDDVLITRAGPRVRVGICCHVKAVRRKLMICDKVYRLRVDKTKALPGYIELLINSPDRVEEIDILKTGISDSGLNLTQTKIKDIQFQKPCVLEQKEIISRVQKLFVRADDIEARYRLLKQKVGELPEHILSKAFRGGLGTSVENKLNVYSRKGDDLLISN